jgi:hypothetical protein
MLLPAILSQMQVDQFQGIPSARYSSRTELYVLEVLFEGFTSPDTRLKHYSSNGITGTSLPIIEGIK